MDKVWVVVSEDGCCSKPMSVHRTEEGAQAAAKVEETKYRWVDFLVEEMEVRP